MSQSDNPWISLYKSIPSLDLEGQLTTSDAEEFLTKARQAIESAKNEVKYGDTISDLVANDDAGISEGQNSLATIGVWHYECAIELFNKAQRNFSRAMAAGLSKDSYKEVEAQMGECQKQVEKLLREKSLAKKSMTAS
jgi:hypothetical protein